MIRARAVAALLALAVASCGGKVEGPGGSGGGGSGGGGGAGSGGGSSPVGGGGPVGGDLPPGQTGTGGGPAPSGSSSPGNPGGPGPSCTMTGGDGLASVDGGCESVAEFGTCGGTQYEVSCDCQLGVSVCKCLKDGQKAGNFTSLEACVPCTLPDGAWSACGFP